MGIETEFWVEEFVQSEVPFDLESAERNYRVTCADLSNPAYVSKQLFGCIEAKEQFTFIPITLQTSYSRDLGRRFRAGAGYGIGVLAGFSAYRDDGQLLRRRRHQERYHPLPDLAGREPRAKGVRRRGVPSLEMARDRLAGRLAHIRRGRTDLAQSGRKSSSIFRAVFPEAKDGARMYFQSFTSNPEDDKIFVGTEAEAKAKATREGSRFHLVNGDFTGWFAALKLNFYWRDI